VSRLDDPALVASEYADESRLRRRAAGYAGAGTRDDARVPLVDAVVAAAPARVLEVGCGWGELAEWIARETGADVVAVDLSLRMVELATERGIDASVADVQSLPFEDATFDVVVAAWMLYHVPDLGRGLAEIARVLRPGGTFVAATNSRLHLQGLRDLVGSGPSTLKFSREDGDDHLRGHFASVERTDLDGVLELTDRAAVEDYVGASISMSPFIANLPEEIDLPFVARRGSSVFVAVKAT
jgi:SAM-dependent methyltransferase